MPNIITLLKEEMCRLARGEIKAETRRTEQVIAQYRRDVAQLKRQLCQQEMKIASLEMQQHNGKRQAAKKPRRRKK